MNMPNNSNITSTPCPEQVKTWNILNRKKQHTFKMLSLIGLNRTLFYRKL